MPMPSALVYRLFSGWCPGLPTIALSCLFALTACGPTPIRGDGGALDTVDGGPRVGDGGLADGGRPVPDSPDAGRLDEHGFWVRIPQVRSVPCVDECGAAMVELPDEDFLCTFKVGSDDGFVYVQATPRAAGFVNNTYDTTAWSSVGGRVESLAATYDYGHHHNDSLTFTYQGQASRYYHSSFGFGYRACAPMDCVQGLTGGLVTDDGCTPARSRPVVCVPIASDGSASPLEDHFAKCPGDPNGP